MNREEFIRMLEREAYPEPEEVQREPNGYLDLHTHPFEVKALILSGSIDLVIDHQSKTFGPGDIFHLAYEEQHAESYGPQGVHYLAARKQSTT
jgi:quercetin dioxygenase-like cupin family protein